MHLQPTVRRFRVVAATCLIAVAGLTGCSTGSSDDVAGEPAATRSSAEPGAFPVTIDHALGRTTVEQEPTRVVTLGWSDQDVALALGVVPVGDVQHRSREHVGVWPMNHSCLRQNPAHLAIGAHDPIRELALLATRHGLLDAPAELLTIVGVNGVEVESPATSPGPCTPTPCASSTTRRAPLSAVTEARSVSDAASPSTE